MKLVKNRNGDWSIVLEDGFTEFDAFKRNFGWVLTRGTESIGTFRTLKDCLEIAQHILDLEV